MNDNGAVDRPILELKGITKWIDTGTHRVEILRGIDLTVERGEYVAIMGASGSGKSTLLGLLAGLDTPSAGSIRLDGEEISGLGEDRLSEVRGRKIGFVFQSYQLIPTLTAEENVLLPAELAGELDRERVRARAATAEYGRTERAVRPLPGAAFGWRAAARGAGARVYAAASAAAGR